MSFPRITDALSVVTPQRTAAKGVEATSRVREGPGKEAEPVRELAVEERSKIAERLHDLARASGRDLEFRVDEASDRVVISVRDERTGELIRQIPDATALRIAQRLESQAEVLRNVLFEDRA